MILPEKFRNAVFGMLSRPGAFLRGRFLSMSFISPGEFGDIFEMSGELSICNDFCTSFSYLDVTRGHVN